MKKLISDYQFGFCMDHGRTEELSRITSKTRNALENNKYCYAVFLDVAQTLACPFDHMLRDTLYKRSSLNWPSRILQHEWKKRAKRQQSKQNCRLCLILANNSYWVYAPRAKITHNRVSLISLLSAYRNKWINSNFTTTPVLFKCMV